MSTTDAENINVASMVESVVGCKWSLSILAQIRSGINRPGELEKNIDGLSGKVLNQRLKKMQKFGILERKVFPEVPPHVEYQLTSFGSDFSAVLDLVDQLEAARARLNADG